MGFLKDLGLTICFGILMVSSVPSLAIAQGPIEELSNPQRNSLAALIEANTRFAFELYHQLKTQKGNLLFSPYSISTVFAMAASGAKENTLTEMQKVLHFSPTLASSFGQLNEALKGSEGKNATQLIMANALWLQKGMPLLPNYQTLVTKNYRANIEQVNFDKEPVEAVRIINRWVAQQTRGKINQLLTSQDLSAQTRLVLTSAIYMKGQWESLFDLKLTKKAPFYLSEKHSLQVEMMTQTARYPLLVQNQLAVIQIPYSRGNSQDARLALFILLPQGNYRLETIEKAFTPESWLGWVKHMQTRSVELSLPRFRIDNRLDLNQTMIELGMIEAFSSKANFSGITGHKDLSISKAVHKTFMRVDEKGTEAAAATGAAISLTSVREEEETPYQFTVDRAFIFMIADTTTNSILFMGRVLRP